MMFNFLNESVNSYTEEVLKRIKTALTNPNAAKAKGKLYSRATYTVQVGLE